MKQTAQQILDEVIHLPLIDRAEPLNRIIGSFDSDSDNDIKKAWADKAERRPALHRSGDF